MNEWIKERRKGKDEKEKSRSKASGWNRLTFMSIITGALMFLVPAAPTFEAHSPFWGCGHKRFFFGFRVVSCLKWNQHLWFNNYVVGTLTGIWYYSTPLQFPVSSRRAQKTPRQRLIYAQTEVSYPLPIPKIRLPVTDFYFLEKKLFKFKIFFKNGCSSPMSM